MARSWSEIVEKTAKKMELAAMFKCSVQHDAHHCEWLAQALRELARLADRSTREQAAKVAAFRLLGLKLTISRDG